MIAGWFEQHFSSTALDGQLPADAFFRLEEIQAAGVTLFPRDYFQMGLVNTAAALCAWVSEAQARFPQLAPKVRPALWSAPVGVPYRPWKLASAFRQLEWFEKEEKVRSTPEEIPLELYREMPKLAAIALAHQELSYQLALSYAHQRIQGGRAIVRWSGVAQQLAVLHARLSIAKNFLENPTVEAALALLSGADDFISACMQVMGGSGYCEDYRIERYLREALFLKNWLFPLSSGMIDHYTRTELAKHGQ